MTVEEKVKELLEKEYSISYWDYHNDEPNSDQWMLEQTVNNSLIVVEEIKKECSAERRHFYREVEQKLLNMKNK